MREAEQGIKGFLAGNASPLVEHEKPPADELTAAGYGFYTAGILEKLAETPYDEMIAGDIVWVGTPEDVIERIEAMREVCEGLTEVSITVNPGGFDHWQAIKNQELFAHRVMPHFKGETRKVKANGLSSGVAPARALPEQVLAADLERRDLAARPICRGAGFQTPHERR